MFESVSSAKENIPQRRKAKTISVANRCNDKIPGYLT